MSKKWENIIHGEKWSKIGTLTAVREISSIECPSEIEMVDTYVMSSSLGTKSCFSSFSNGRFGFDYGLVHFVVMSTEHDFSRGTNQYHWIANHLANVDRSTTPWLVFTGHRQVNGQSPTLCELAVAKPWPVISYMRHCPTSLHAGSVTNTIIQLQGMRRTSSNPAMPRPLCQNLV